MNFRRMMSRYTDTLSDLGHRVGNRFSRIGAGARESLGDAYQSGRSYYREHLRPGSSSSTGSVITASTCASLAAGALLMYLFDPTLGRRRRHVVRDKLVSAVHQIGDCCDATARDFFNRGKGVWHSMTSSFGGGGDAPDRVIEDRVRSLMGRYVSHTKAVQVWSDGGHVILCGEILQEELKPALKVIGGVTGVKSVRHSLLPYKSRGHVPSMQGGTPRPGMAPDVAQENWSPTTRVLAGLAGATLVGWGASSRSAPSLLGGALGVGLLGRAVINLPAKRLIGAGGGRRAIDVRKTININAPIDQVFGFWSNYENFPLFMRNVREVRDYGNGVSHWVVAGPAGLKAEWDAVLTEFVPNQCVAWKSVPGSIVANAGVVQFQENPDGTTRVDVRLSYNPPGGALGHALAGLFASDPKTEMDQDLVRMKTTLETGNLPHDAAQHLTESGTTTSAR